MSNTTLHFKPTNKEGDFARFELGDDWKDFDVDSIGWVDNYFAENEVPFTIHASKKAILVSLKYFES